MEEGEGRKGENSNMIAINVILGMIGGWLIAESIGESNLVYAAIGILLIGCSLIIAFVK